MRISELEARDPSLGRSIRTALSEGWSAQYGKDIRVVHKEESGQLWRAQRLLSAFFCGIPIPPARRFLADLFRYTSRPARMPLQYLVGTALAHPLSFRLSGTAFRVDPGLPRAEDLLVIPGNRRIRVFDFGLRRSRVFAIGSRGRTANLQELSVRSGQKDPFLIPVFDHAQDGSWIEEPIENASPLPRLKPWQSTRTFSEKAWDALASHLVASARNIDATDHVKALLAKGEDCTSQLRETSPDFPHERIRALLVRLAEQANRMGTITLARGHGDFQPGNVLVRSDGSILLIDWEYAQERWIPYDFFVFALRARAPVGLSERLKALDLEKLAGRLPDSLHEQRKELRQRGSLALFLLEELLWSLEDEVDLGLKGTSERIKRIVAELRTL